MKSKYDVSTKRTLRQRRVENIQTLTAYSGAYNRPINREEKFKFCSVHGMLFAFFATILFYHPLFSIFAFIVGYLYAQEVLLLRSVVREYENDLFMERNKFINSLTQQLPNPSKTLYQSLQATYERTNNLDFKKNLKELIDSTRDGDENDKEAAYTKFREVYEDDVFFSLFVEQLETISTEGKESFESLKAIKSYHNGVKKLRVLFVKKKEVVKSGYKLILGLIAFVAIAMTIGVSFEIILNDFSRSPIGWISGGLFMIVSLRVYSIFYKKYYDDNITEEGAR